jgi:CheY-like chemotaxis protein
MGDVEEDELDLPTIWKRGISGGSVESLILDTESMPTPESNWLRNLDGLKPTFKRRRKRNKKDGVDDSRSSVSHVQGVDKAIAEESLTIEEPAKKVAKENKGNFPLSESSTRSMGPRNSMSSLSRHSVLSKSSSIGSNHSQSDRKTKALKARITMFPPFQAKLDLLKASAQDMMDDEEDPTQQDIIAQQFAEASLTLLRQLRYHCMNSGLDGWRQGKIRRKVLIIDDSLVTRKMVSRAFEKANFIVDTAENGMEGVTKLKESIYDIAFMDIDMPVMNGFDATKTLREWEDAKRPGARQPICALTAAYVDDFERSELMKFKDAGLDVMESKPCNIPRLFKVVDDVSPMFSDLSLTVTQHLNEFL